jgi:CBS domain containing-hemolysin-like protein
MLVSTFFVVVFLILINAFYVAAEFAVVGVRATRVEQLAAQGHRLASALLPILRDPARLDRYIAACQIGITVSSLILGAFGQATIGLALGAALIDYGGVDPLGAYTLSATITLVVLSSTQVVLGELIPKTLALQYPLRAALVTYLPMRWSLALFAPFIDLLNGSGSLVLRLFGVNAASTHRHVHAPDEIDLLIRESRDGGLLEHKESERLREALRLGRHRIRQIMVPRRRMASLDLNAPTERILAEVRASPFTRLPVHRGGFDDVRGYLHVKDLAVALAEGRDVTGLRALVRPLLVLPSSLTVDRALAEMRDRRARIALLVDEYGDLEGLVSLEDIIRELLGKLSDELTSGSDSAPMQLPDGRWRMSGRLPLEGMLAWVQTLGAHPYPGDSSAAETLAGWLLERLDAIPEGACCLRAGELCFEIERMDGAAIDSVLVWNPGAAPGECDA